MIHVVVPAYNEAANIERMLQGVAERLVPFAVKTRIVVVDDGSLDDTVARVRATACGVAVEVLEHGKNQGPGAAFRTGFLHVLKGADPLDVVVTLESDSTSDPAILSRLLRRVWEEGDDIALASCYAYGGGIVGTRLHRVGLSHVANGLMKKTLGLSGLSTLSSFYRVYQVSALRAMQSRWGDAFITARGFECMVEVLYRAAQLRLRVSEVPMLLDGSKRQGRSNMKIARTSLAYLGLAARAFFGRL